MKGREPDAWLTEFGDNSLNFLLLVWVNRQGARRPTRTRSAYLWALETKLSEYGIEIPFPQRDLHLRTGWADGPANQPDQKRQDEDSDEADAPDNS
jgi:potassium efflux system protein